VQQLDLGAVGAERRVPSPTIVHLRRNSIYADLNLQLQKESTMKWSTPKVTEVCIGMEINDYMPAEL
jgi:coenzyme PQQ precursor peptide PqqA